MLAHGWVLAVLREQVQQPGNATAVVSQSSLPGGATADGQPRGMLCERLLSTMQAWYEMAFYTNEVPGRSGAGRGPPFPESATGGA